MNWQNELLSDTNDSAWSRIDSMWANAALKSPFSSPQSLRIEARRALSRGCQPILVSLTSTAGDPLVCWSLQLDRRRQLSFLQSQSSDELTCLSASGVSVEQATEGLVAALEHWRPKTVFFDKLLPDGITRSAIIAALRQAGWWHRAFAATPSPIVSVDATPDQQIHMAREFTRHKRLKTYHNRIARMDGFAFEVLENDTDLDDWAREFCDAHEWRWNETTTPSKYRFACERAEFRERLRAWIQDDVLVRFSIRLADGRVALVAALKCDDRLIYHLVVTKPAAPELRAGHVLIRLIGIWMSEHGYRVLDFGCGGEDYKHRYANQDRLLWRVYGASSIAPLCRMRAVIEAKVRNSDRLQRCWDVWGNQTIRYGAPRRLLQRVASWQPLRTLSTMCREPRKLAQLVRDDKTIYVAQGSEGRHDPFVQELAVSDVLDAQPNLSPALRAQYFARRRRGNLLLGVRIEGQIACAAWLFQTTSDAAMPGLKADSCWSVEECGAIGELQNTEGLTRVLRAIRSRLTPDDVIVLCHASSRASQRGAIIEAGFRPIARRCQWKFSGKVICRRLSDVASAQLERESDYANTLSIPQKSVG